jgi:hypothetical protein
VVFSPFQRCVGNQRLRVQGGWKNGLTNSGDGSNDHELPTRFDSRVTGSRDL